MNRQEMIVRMLYWAERINAQSGDGALHIFIADGNCDDESLEFCYNQPNITDAERQFIADIQISLTDAAIAGAWALAKHTD